MMRYAKRYRDEFGFSVIPVGEDKKPLLPWQSYQQRHATDEELTAWTARWPKLNLGIVTGKISNLAVVDIDTAEGAVEIRKYIPDSLPCPIAKTRKGKHLYFRHSDELRNNARKISGCDFRGEGGYVVAPPSVIAGHTYTFEHGHLLSKTPIPVLPDAYIKAVTSRKPESQVITEMFQPGRRDEDLFHVANCLVKGDMPENEVRQVLHVLGKHCGFSMNDVEQKIISAVRRGDQQATTLIHDVMAYLDQVGDYFSCPDIYHALSVTDKRHKNAIRQLIFRMHTNNQIIRHGERPGCYRKVNTITETINVLEEDTSEQYYDLPLPLNLGSLVSVMPKNIIMVAGFQNAGKTAFLMTLAYNFIMSHFVALVTPRSTSCNTPCNTLACQHPENDLESVTKCYAMSHFVALFGSSLNNISFKAFKTIKEKTYEAITKNQNQLPKPNYQHAINCQPINYLTSEMSAQELRDRLRKFNLPLEAWATFVTFSDRSTNFADAIQPNAINIIDYLELHDNFWQAGGMIRQIHDKLDQGIAIIAMQKGANTKTARGGDFTREKPRLYITLDEGGKAEITKAKIWKDSNRNPNGLQCRYECRNGVEMVQTEDWGLYVNEGL